MLSCLVVHAAPYQKIGCPAVEPDDTYDQRDSGPPNSGLEFPLAVSCQTTDQRKDQ